MRVKIDEMSYTFDAPLPTYGEKSFQYMLARLLVGPVTVSHESVRVFQKTNYAKIPSNQQTNLRGARAFLQFLSDYNYDANATQFIKKTLPINREFFRDLLAEFSYYLIQSERKSNISGFVFLYRLLERMSYSAPLLYSKRSHDFVGTFNELKAMFTSEAAGELGLFRKFINSGNFIDKTILDTTYNIDFSTHTDRDKHFRIITKIFNGFQTATPNTYQLQIKFRDIPSLLINIRNRFFHLRTGDGKSNIAIKDLGDPDNFFSELNPVICSFLAVVALHLVRP